MLEIRNIKKQFQKKKILNEVSIDFDPSKITALVGSNGAGKSTLLKVIIGLEKPNSGNIIWNKKDINSLTTHKRVEEGLGYMSQDSTAISDMSIENNLYLVPLNKKYKKKTEEDYRENLLNEFGLSAIRHQKCNTLSGGELQKLEFCLSMATRPKLILLDEPFAGLDPKTVKFIIDLIKKLSSKNIGFIITEHRIEELKNIASHFILLHEQEVLFSGISKISLKIKK